MSICRTVSCVVGRGCLLFLLWPVLLRWWNRRTCTHLFFRELTAEQTSTGECWIPPRKDTPHPRAKEKPQPDSRRGKTAFRIKAHTRQRHSEGSNKTLCAPGTTNRPRDWGRATTILLVFGSQGQMVSAATIQENENGKERKKKSC